MISALVFDQLLLVALVCICLFHLWWPDGRAANSQKPLKPPKKCSKAPKLFAGLLHKPRCEACGHGVNTRPKAPDTSPPLLRFTRGRRRTIDPWNHFCPDQACSYYGWLGRGNIRSNGHPGGKPWRQCQCVSCHGYFQQTYGTPFHGKRGSPDMLVWAVGALCEGLGIRAVARVFEVAPNTVLAWFVAAADQLKAFSQ